MRQSLHRRLQRLEQVIHARPVSAEPASSDHIEKRREALRVTGVEQQRGESLAMTVGRAMGISQAELRDRLRVLACA